MYQLYFIKAEDNVYKIGISSKAHNRLIEMQTDNHKVLEIVLTLTFENQVEALRTEDALHRAFSRLWIHGEWFQLDDETISGIEQLFKLKGAISVDANTTLSNPKSRIRKQPKQIAFEYLQKHPDNYTVRSLADAAGVSNDAAHKALRMYENGN